MVKLAIGVLAALLVAINPITAAAEAPEAVTHSGFIYEKAPFPSCHASTLVETKEGLVAAWFGGTAEGNDDVGIWLSHHDGKNWSAPVEVATGKSPEHGKRDDAKRYPTWNPVLFRPKGGPDGALVLFYKVGPNPRQWWGMRKVSTDGGRSWSEPQTLGEGLLGPIKNKPIQLADGSLLCGSSTEHDGWRVHLEKTFDLGASGQKIVPAEGGNRVEGIQPTFLRWGETTLQIVCRPRRSGVLVEAWSKDNGVSWSALAPMDLPNSSTGVDAVTLADARGLLVYNHTPRGRTPLNVAISSDGKTWKNVAALETDPGEYSYPAVIQASDGKVHITYTWKRQKIKHVVLDPTKLR